MADYRLDCCGGFPRCVCEDRKKEEEERELLAAEGYRKVSIYTSNVRGTQDKGFLCESCGSWVLDKDKHNDFHRKLDHVVAMNSLIK